MKRLLGSLQRRSSSTLNGSPAYPDDSPEARIINEVNAFCASGHDPGSSQGTEFVHLPAIVENAESSPSAAKEAAVLIRKLLSDPAGHPPFVLYNAIMLVRILVDNPGHTFTRNMDAKFVSTVKSLLRNARDMGVQHFVRETLNALEAQRSWDEDLKPLLQMWEKEKNKPGSMNSSNFIHPPNAGRTLPNPDELSARISEAKTSAKLLIQFVESTPVAEMFDNELVKEFSDRCRSASRSMQTYIHSTDPTPDEDTLTTLIETNDELSVAVSKYHNAILKARKTTGRNGTPSPAPSSETASATASGARQPAPPLPRRDTQSPPVLPATATVSAPMSDVPMSPTGGIPSTGAREQFPAVPQRDTHSPSVVPATVPVQEPTPVSPASPTSATGGLPSTGTGRYEYRSEDFQVQNPFADDYATEGRSETQNTQRPAKRT